MDHTTIIKHMLSKIDKTKTCWIWIGLFDGKSPLLVVNGKQFSARKYSNLLINLPPFCNKTFSNCGDYRCVNPDHITSGDVSRFWQKVQKLKETDGCWIWTGSEDKNGYGKFTRRENGRQLDLRAHRYSWELYTGRPAPSNLLLCHVCDNPRCVNPRHLFLGTNQDNINDRDQKGRANTPVGSRSSLSKLKEIDIIYIRESKKTAKYLAKELGVNINTIYRIKNHQSWKHIV